jgi:aerobic-type carbon monoxide dehydrogenase small subunit (CoxS/CutS family)
MRLKLNGQDVEIPADQGDEPLLFVLRDHFNLNGPKYGCGVGACGACVVLVDGAAQRSCLLTPADVEAASVTTQEGLMADGDLHPLQQAWIDHSVPQCGYCQNGQIMTAAGLLQQNPQATGEDIADAMDGVICRCGTQVRIRAAIADAQQRMGRS